MENVSLINDGYQSMLALLTLSEKLKAMVQKAEVLKDLPDRYGSYEAIRKSVELSEFKLGSTDLDEINAFAEKIDEVTKELSSIIKKFDDADNTLYEIKEVMAADKAVLERFKVCYNQLEQFVSEFPHQGKDDLAEVKKKIAKLKEMDDLIVEAGKTVDGIRDYADRHNKGALVTRYKDLLNEIQEKMSFEDVEKYTKKLKQVKSDVGAVKTAFDNEKTSLENLRLQVQKMGTEMWKDDHLCILDEINKRIAQGNNLRMSPFEMSSIKDRITTAKDRKTRDVSAMTDKYGWLLRRRHREFHERLASQHITYEDYRVTIEERKKEKNSEAWNDVWNVLKYTIGIPILIAVFFIDLFLSGKDD